MAYDVIEVLEMFDNFDTQMQKAVDSYKHQLANIRAGRANPRLLDSILVNYYGTPTPINQIGTISVPEARMIVISVWDVSALKAVEKAIIDSPLGITPNNDGKVIRLVFPVLTEERRKELVKQVKKQCEDSKVAVRNIRRDAMDALKKMKNNKELSEDEHALAEKEVEKVISKAIEEVDKASADKEKDVLTV